MDRETVTRCFVVLFAVDVLFITLHVLGGWSVINLDEEGNLTTWYSSAKLLVACGLCFLIWKAERRAVPFPGQGSAWLWVVVSLLFLLLSADETSSMHERLARTIMRGSEVGLDIRESVLGSDKLKDSFAWVLLLSPVIIGVSAFLFFFFHRRLKGCRKAYFCAFAALGLFLLAVVMETTIYQMPAFSQWTDVESSRYQLGITIEESGEVFGASLFLLTFLTYLRFVGSRPQVREPAASVA